MALDLLRTDQLIEIVRAGGGLKINASIRKTADLMSLAQAAAAKQVSLHFTGCSLKQPEDLLAIARAGAGCVVFED